MRYPDKATRRTEIDRMVNQHCKKQIEAYWAERGYQVDVRLIEQPFSQADRCMPTLLTSDMMNGYPMGYHVKRTERILKARGHIA